MNKCAEEKGCAQTRWAQLAACRRYHLWCLHGHVSALTVLRWVCLCMVRSEPWLPLCYITNSPLRRAACFNRHFMSPGSTSRSTIGSFISCISTYTSGPM